MDKKVLLANINKIHTTNLGFKRIQKKLNLGSKNVTKCLIKYLFYFIII